MRDSAVTPDVLVLCRWPRGVRANGHLLLNSEKVSVSCDCEFVVMGGLVV